MKQKIISVLVVATMILPAFAQYDIDDVLSTIEQNNTTLVAARQEAEAEQLGNRTDIFLDGPSIDMSYSWGHPQALGTQQTLSVSQSLDVATITGARHRVAEEQNRLVDWDYASERQRILLEAKLCCIDLVYYNHLYQLLSVRTATIAQLVAKEQERLNEGSSHRLIINDAILSLSTLQATLSNVQTERDVLLHELIALNGGQPVEFKATDYDTVAPPADFATWYAGVEQSHPLLAYAHQQTEVTRREVTLRRLENLPTLSVGYTSEYVPHENLQGVSVGVSLPLWANKNKVRQARTAQLAAEARHTDVRQQCYRQFHSLYVRTVGLRRTADIYNEAAQKADNTALLQKAVAEGHISVLGYLLDFSKYYEYLDKALQAERDYQRAYAQLTSILL